MGGGGGRFGAGLRGWKAAQSLFLAGTGAGKRQAVGRDAMGQQGWRLSLSSYARSGKWPVEGGRWLGTEAAGGFGGLWLNSGRCVGASGSGVVD